MPLPLIIGLGVGIGAASAGIWRTITGVGRIKVAQRRYEARRGRYENVRLGSKHRQEDTERDLKDFGQQRLEAMVSLGKAAEFLRKARVRDRQLFEELHIPTETLDQWEGASLKAIEVLSGAGGSVISGALTAAGVYGLVGALASASTGTAIATLTGVAAQNATLAWLGGGTLAAGGGGVALGTAVLAGFVIGPAILVSSFFIHAKASQVERVVEQNVAEMDRAEAAMQAHAAYLSAVLRRVEELRQATSKLKLDLEGLLTSASPHNAQEVLRVAKVARGLGAVLDAAVLDKNGTPIEPGATPKWLIH